MPVRVRFVLALMLGAAAVACGSNPAQPSASSASGSTSATASVTVPRPVAPADNAQIANAAQPITLVVRNAVVTGSGPTTYTFEVATDPAFASRVQTKDHVAENAGGQTSITLDALGAGTDYYWHARATSGGTTGVFSAISKLTIGQAVVLNAPVPVAPLTGASTSSRPNLTVTNAGRQGPAGAITYRFEIATNPQFTAIVFSGTVPEAPSQTSFAPPADLTSGQTYYWRVTAIDQGNAASSAPSVVQSFTVQTSQAAGIAAVEGAVLWPGAQPPGTPGHAALGDGWEVRTVVSFDGVTHVVPTLDELRVFDLLDRGMDPNAALGWMNANGYDPQTVYFPDVAEGVFGFRFEYMALTGGKWILVVRVGG